MAGMLRSVQVAVFCPPAVVSFGEPEALSKRTADRISSTAAYEYRFDHPAEEAEPEGFPIIEYYGTYGDCVAVMLGFLYGGFFPVAGKVFVADIAFYYLDTNRIKIWKEF